MGTAFAGNAVPYHHTREQVNNDAEIYCIALDFEVGNVTGPYLIGTCHTEFLINQIRIFLPLMARLAPSCRPWCFYLRPFFDWLHLSPLLSPLVEVLLFYRFSRLRRNSRLCMGKKSRLSLFRKDDLSRWTICDFQFFVRCFNGKSQTISPHFPAFCRIKTHSLVVNT